MNRFADAEAERLYLTGLSARLPRGILRRAYRAIHVLVDARELQDIRVVGKIDRLKGGQRLIVCIAQKWHFTFDWERGIGSKEIRLERLKT